MHDLKPCQHQVAGHLFEQGKAGSLVDEHGHFYKPIQPGPRGDREKNFYTFLKEKRDQDRKNHLEKDWDPKIMDTLSYIIDGGSFKRAIRELSRKEVTEPCAQLEPMDAPVKILEERVPTFSRSKSILYNGSQRSIQVLQKDEFGLLDGLNLEAHDIIWSDEEEEPWYTFKKAQTQHVLDLLNQSTEKSTKQSEDLLQTMEKMPFIVRNAPLLRTIPKFFKVCTRDGHTLLELEDVARSYDRPAIIDIKIGRQTWYDDADEAYIERCKLKDSITTQGNLGFKICGMQVFRHRIGGYWRASKKWCKTITESTVDCALESFVHNQNGLTPSDVFGGAEGVIHQLSLLEDWFSLQTEFQFFSSSLLILYEGNAGDWSGANVSVRMVDFAHTFHLQCGVQRDENYLEGLRSLKARLLGILNRNS